MHFCIQIHIAVYKMEYIYIYLERDYDIHILINLMTDGWSRHTKRIGTITWHHCSLIIIFFLLWNINFGNHSAKIRLNIWHDVLIILFRTLSLPTPINMNQRMSFLNLYIGIGSTVAFGDPSDVGRSHTGGGFEAEAFILLTVCTDGFLLLLEFPLDRSLTESEG